MSSSRSRSSDDISQSGFALNPLNGVLANLTHRSQINGPTQTPAEFILHREETNVTRCLARLKFDEDVDIAIDAKIRPQGRTKYRKFPNVIPTEEMLQEARWKLRALF